MDPLISSALEEICYHGNAGVSLSSLWSTLTPTPSHSIKTSLWTNLLSIPSLQFSRPGSHSLFNPTDKNIQRLEDAEKLDLKIVAKEHLRDSFVGLYDTPSSGISSNQRNALTRLAAARGYGITQNLLAKDLRVESNNFFYVVRSLECRGLIVRRPAVVKMKDNASVATNLLYLYRHAKHLGVQQRFEINEGCVEEPDVGRDGLDGESSSKDTVLVRDYLPEMKTICDQLKEAKDKVLVISDIKQDLGYCGIKGHRAWRNIFRRLKEACVVEEFEAKVDGKVESCLRLLKKFSVKNFESKSHGCVEDCGREVLVKFGKMIQQTDQLVELSLDQQIYDLIDASETKGATFAEEKTFILKVELQKWIGSLEEKDRTIDRRTIDRLLYKLEQQGHCKLQHINVPVITNCGRSRIILVVLHPSIQSFPPELLGEIHDRLRVFEKQNRGEGLSRMTINESVPVLNGVKRTQIHVGSGEKVAKLEAMRINGFVSAKVGRARLLHIFLWNHLSSMADWDNVLSSGAHLCTYKLFELEAVINAIPIGLFLQVAGSAQKFDVMLGKCKGNFCLSDLPVEEYRNLMDTSAINRLSLIIDILRRLKLIRLVQYGHSEDGARVPHATSRHAMELKPYVEEPLSLVAISNLRSLDLRPRIRHDFFLSNREAVDEYWKSLEYCYAAAHRIAAKHAFPGSVVPEVFNHRSWASARVMSADQRSSLQKRIVKDDENKSLSYKECEKIAKDLNLTLQQVLHVYYDKHHQHLNKLQGVANAGEESQLPKKKQPSSSKKRKKSLESSLAKHSRVDNRHAQLDKQGLPNHLILWINSW